MHHIFRGKGYGAEGKGWMFCVARAGRYVSICFNDNGDGG